MNADVIEIGSSKKFATTFVIQGVGALKVAGRHSATYSSVMRQKQFMMRLDLEDETTIIVPTQLIMLCTEAPVDESEEEEDDEDNGVSPQDD